MAAIAISFAPGQPATRSTGLDLARVFLHVAPVTQALKVIYRVVHEITIFVMNLAAPGCSAPLARPERLQPARLPTCAGPCFWWFPRRRVGTRGAAVDRPLKPPAMPRTHAGVRRCLEPRPELRQTLRACFFSHDRPTTTASRGGYCFPLSLECPMCHASHCQHQ